MRIAVDSRPVKVEAENPARCKVIPSVALHQVLDEYGASPACRESLDKRVVAAHGAAVGGG